MSGHYIITGGMPVGADTTTLTFRAFYKGAVVDRTVSITKSKSGSPGGAGAAGDPAVSMSVTNLSMMIMCYAEGTPVDPSFEGKDGQLLVMHGSDDVTYASVLSAVAVGCSGTVNTANNVPVTVKPMGYYRVTAMTADTATLTLSALYAGHTYTVVVSLTKAKGGYEIVSTLPGTNLFIGRMVFLTTDEKLYQYKTGGWTAAVPALDIAGQLVDAQIASLNATKIAGQINDSQIASLNAAKIAGQLTSSQILSAGVGACVSNDPYFADPTAWQTADGAVLPWFMAPGQSYTTVSGATEIASNAPYSSLVSVQGVPCSSAKTYRLSAFIYNENGDGACYIRVNLRNADNSYGTYLFPGMEAITSPANGIWYKFSGLFTTGAYPLMAPAVWLNYGSTTGRYFMQDLRIEEVIPGDLILAGTVTATNMAADSISSVSLQSGSVIAGKVAANSIQAGALQAGSVTAGTLDVGVVQAANIVAGSITGDRLQANSVNADRITANSITGDKLYGGAIITASAQINTGVILSANIGNLQVQSAQIADLTVGTNKITGNAVTRMASGFLAADFTGNATYPILSVAYTPDTPGPIKIDMISTLQNKNITGGAQVYADGITVTKAGVTTSLLWLVSFTNSNTYNSLAGFAIDPNGDTAPRTYNYISNYSTGMLVHKAGSGLVLVEYKK